MGNVAAWAVFAVCAVIDWWAVTVGNPSVESWAKPLTMLALIAVALTASMPPGRVTRLLIAGLTMGLAGDVALLGGSDLHFQLGLAAFLIGHLCYVACFAALGFGAPGRMWAGIGLMAVCLVATREVLPAAQAEGGPALAVPVAVYIGVIALMAVSAWATGSWWIGLGASIFVVSDAVLAINRFVEPWPSAALIVMVTYHLGQALIVIGVLRARRPTAGAP